MSTVASSGFSDFKIAEKQVDFDGCNSSLYYLSDLQPVAGATGPSEGTTVL